MTKEDLISIVKHYVPVKQDRDSVLSAIWDHVKSLTTCDKCNGSGEIERNIMRGDIEMDVPFECSECEGIGLISNS